MQELTIKMIRRERNHPPSMFRVVVGEIK